MKIYAIHSIHHNDDGEFRTSRKVDPLTGEYKVEAVIKDLAPGQIHEVSEGMARSLIASRAAREPTDQELDLHELALRGPRK